MSILSVIVWATWASCCTTLLIWTPQGRRLRHALWRQLCRGKRRVLRQAEPRAIDAAYITRLEAWHRAWEQAFQQNGYDYLDAVRTADTGARPDVVQASATTILPSRGRWQPPTHPSLWADAQHAYHGAMPPEMSLEIARLQRLIDDGTITQRSAEQRIDSWLAHWQGERGVPTARGPLQPGEVRTVVNEAGYLERIVEPLVIEEQRAIARQQDEEARGLPEQLYTQRGNRVWVPTAKGEEPPSRR